MKKSILIFALSRSPWIGGIYYRKNIINMLLKSEKIKNQYNIVLLVNEKHRAVFECFGKNIDIIVCPDDTNILNAGMQVMLCCLRKRVKYVFPMKGNPLFKIIGIKPVSWIADFQHCYYPEFFEQEEIDARNKNFKYMAMANNPLIVSSEAALSDLRHFYSQNRRNVYVVHFTSAIDDEIAKLNEIDQNKLLSNYGLNAGGYFVVCNQFWKHKNHILVLKALKIIKSMDPQSKIKIAFTGEPNDRRNPEFIEEIKKMLSDPDISDNIVMLGFINRTNQLCVMKHAIAIIQPSLFEGWGTVVEDAKVLKKNIILSKIPVHEEQMNSNCILFDKDDPLDLATKLLQYTAKPSDYYNDKTLEYAMALEKVFI